VKLTFHDKLILLEAAEASLDLGERHVAYTYARRELIEATRKLGDEFTDEAAKGYAAQEKE
jgi:hypothetical protein